MFRFTVGISTPKDGLCHAIALPGCHIVFFVLLILIPQHNRVKLFRSGCFAAGAINLRSELALLPTPIYYFGINPSNQVRM
ncbi:hypothetical protein [Tolypothrix sp. VBCCA 56010]|uniref:hypothetical protein n=1 Tax=Tolypothrix sp. VBCCA 56010 TaxID=3137731 RepID=UPI003D7DBC15